MASSSKNISMPLVFAISVGSIFALVASVVFGLAWYEYEARVAIREQVLETPSHPAEYEAALEAQEANLQRTGPRTVPATKDAPAVTYQHTPIEQAMQDVVAEQLDAE